MINSMTNKSKIVTQPYHLVMMSPWPLTGSLSAMGLTLSLTIWFNTNNIFFLPFSLIAMALTMICWWRDIYREASYSGSHTFKVQQGLEWGMILFITSELMFFSAFFWAFFHSSLAPVGELGYIWPPVGQCALNPFSIPLLNTAILLGSGITVTYSHHALLNSNKAEMMYGLLITTLLGLYFTYLQAMEYLETSFSFADSVYGSTFFIATGFHGLHVMIGSTFLLICLIRSYKNHFAKNHHFGFEAAAWYWHFVDVIWIFLFISMYWWAS